MPPWLTILSWVSIILGLITAAAIGLDVRRYPQRMKIMNVVWPVTGLYLPVLAWWLYRTMGYPMAVDAAKATGSTRKWKSVFLSATHCASGCVVGNVIGAPIVFATGWTLLGEHLFSEYVVEFGLAYAVGIAFQYFPIRAMRQLSPAEAVKDAVKADTLSLTAFEVGMFGWMAITHYVLLADYRPESPTALFWFIMQVGMILGFATTFPANWFLIRWGVKSGM